MEVCLLLELTADVSLMDCIVMLGVGAMVEQTGWPIDKKEGWKETRKLINQRCSRECFDRRKL
jgi:hypothetical protein